jgi:hypothetical protein
LTAYRDKIFASLACYRTRRICKFPCGLLRTKNHHFAVLRFPDFQRMIYLEVEVYRVIQPLPVLSLSY